MSYIDPTIHPNIMQTLDYIGNWLSSISLEDWAWVGVAIHFILTIYIFVRILSNQRNTSIAIAWLVLLFAIPFIGIIAYILIGEPYLGKRYKLRSTKAQQILEQRTTSSERQFGRVDEQLPDRYKGVSRIGQVDTGLGVYNQQNMRLLTSPDSIFDALIADINAAKTLIIMEFYIIFPKGRVQEVFEALIAAKGRGVECQILADSVGSFSFFVDDWFEKLKATDIVIHQSLPVGLFKTLFKRSDLRNHRKIVVIDERVGYTGSFNLVDPEFFKQDKDVGQWIDIAMRITSEAPISIVSAMAMVSLTDISAESEDNFDALSHFIDRQINNYTRKLYHPEPTINDVNDKASSYRVAKFTDKKAATEGADKQVDNKQTNNEEIDNKEASDKEVNDKHTGQIAHDKQAYEVSTVHQSTKASLPQQAIANMPIVEEVLAQLIPSAPRLTEHVIYNTLLTVLNRADRHITITTPYFVPDEALLSALTTAAKRGVDVTLIVPYKVDSFLVQHASQASYRILLEAGVTIALFKGGLLHAKTVVIDGDYCLFGTVNMDMRSFYLNMEVSLALYTPEIVAQVLTCQQAYLSQCELLVLEEWNKRPNYLKLFDAGIRLFSPLL